MREKIFGWETLRDTTYKFQAQMEDNIKMDFKENGRALIGYTWLWLETQLWVIVYDKMRGIH